MLAALEVSYILSLLYLCGLEPRTSTVAIELSWISLYQYFAFMDAINSLQEAVPQLIGAWN